MGLSGWQINVAFAKSLWSQHSIRGMMGNNYLFDVGKRHARILKQIAGFSAVDASDTEKKLATQSKGHRCGALIDHNLDALANIRRDAILLGQLALQIGGKPDASQRPRLGQKGVGIKHLGGKTVTAVEV